MKSTFTRLALAVTLMLFSCTTVRYTQKQVMDRYKNSQDVKKQFGLPNEKKVSDTTEEWLYSYRGSKIEHPFETVTVPQFGEYNSYLVFCFDKHANVVRWQAQRVDLTERKVSAGKTVALVLTLSAVATVVVGIIALSAPWHEFGTFEFK